jgi:hypothetical protein
MRLIVNDRIKISTRGSRVSSGQRAWPEWLLYVLRGVEQMAAWTTAQIAALRAPGQHMSDYVRRKLATIYSRELVGAIFWQPVCRIAHVVDTGIARSQAGSR